MTAAMDVEKDIDRILTLLRNKIREKGFTQLEVQERLSWGRSYISQLLTKQKSLRVEQILRILDIIGVEPSDFYSELYHLNPVEQAVRNVDDYIDSSNDSASRMDTAGQADAANDDIRRRAEEMRSMLRAVVRLLVDKDVMSVDELNAAVRRDTDSFLADDVLGDTKPN